MSKENLDKLHKQIADLKVEALIQSKKHFKEASEELFIKYPELESFSWRQYTPYFNDGEPCRFGVHNDYPTVVLTTATEEEKEIASSWGEVVGQSENAEEIEKAVIEFLKAIDEEAYEEMFDDHVEVKVTRKGVEVEEYDHD